MKQLLRLNQIRSTHRTSVEATVRALVIAWVLHESTTTWLRTLLSATASSESVVVSSWLVSESAKYRGAPLRHSPDRATLPAWNLHMKHSISTNCALC
jgi:hypothetical protein